jgi:hypothetical protein
VREIAYDGTPIQAGAKHEDYALSMVYAHYSVFGVREMVVVARYYVDDPRNRSKRFVEYVCRDVSNNELYPFARQLSAMGGVDDGDDNTLHPSTTPLPGTGPASGSMDPEQAPALAVDGDQVLVAFVEGSRSRPVIVGVFRQAGSNAYGATTVDGERRLTQHKGTSIEIKSDGTYVITAKGGSTITMDTDGNITVNAAAGALMQAGDGTVPLDSTMGAVNGLAIDPFTGSTQFALGNASVTVLVKK